MFLIPIRTLGIYMILKQIDHHHPQLIKNIRLKKKISKGLA